MKGFLAILSAAALLAGCGKEPPTDSSPPPVAPASAAAPSTAPNSPSPSAAEPPRVVADPGPPPSSGGNSGGTVVAEPGGAAAMPNIGEMIVAPVAVMIEQKRKIAVLEAKDILRTYEAMNDQRPKSLEEAAEALHVKCPQPAEGWRWRYDPRTGEIDMVQD